MEYAEKDREWLEEFVNFLISEEYLELSAGSFPTVQLNENSFSVIKNEKNISRRLNETVSFDYYEIFF